MATTLPTITVTDAQMTRLQAAFTDPNGVLTPTQNYKQWLIAQLINYVKVYETSKYDVTQNQNREAFQSQIDQDFTGIT